MNDTELAEKLISNPYFGKYEMRIPLEQRSIAVKASTGIKFIWSGIDWDNGMMFLEPEEDLVSWSYIEHYVPDIKEQIEKERHRREKEVYSWK